MEIIPATLKIIEEGRKSGVHSGAQIYISQECKPLVDMAIGESHDGHKMRPQTLLSWMSSTKPIAAVAIAQLWEKGLLTLDDPIYHHIPEIESRGKDKISIRHALTHTAGIRSIDGGDYQSSWDNTIHQICNMPIEKNWEVGEKAGYHLSSTWFILGEIIRRLDGRPIDRYVRDEIFIPLGMVDSWIGMPEEVYLGYESRIGGMYNTTSQEMELLDWHTKEHCGWVAPGSNGRGPMGDLGRFYEGILKGGRGIQNRFLSRDSISTLTSRHRTGMFDHTFQHIIDWGLGFIINSNQYGSETVPYGYGLHCSENTYGHSGRQSSTAFADPEHDLVVAVAFNGMPGERAHQKRIRQVLTSLYEDLDLI